MLQQQQQQIFWGFRCGFKTLCPHYTLLLWLWTRNDYYWMLSHDPYFMFRRHWAKIVCSGSLSYLRDREWPDTGWLTDWLSERFTNRLTKQFIDWLIGLLANRLTELRDSAIDWMKDSPIDWLNESPTTHRSTDWTIRRSTDWTTHWSTDWTIRRSSDWTTHRSTCWMTHRVWGSTPTDCLPDWATAYLWYYITNKRKLERDETWTDWVH
jgi:hypothetical protein